MAVQNQLKAALAEAMGVMRDDLRKQFTADSDDNPFAVFQRAWLGAMKQTSDEQHARLRGDERADAGEVSWSSFELRAGAEKEKAEAVAQGRPSAAPPRAARSRRRCTPRSTRSRSARATIASGGRGPQGRGAPAKTGDVGWWRSRGLHGPAARPRRGFEAKACGLSKHEGDRGARDRARFAGPTSPCCCRRLLHRAQPGALEDREQGIVRVGRELLAQVVPHHAHRLGERGLELVLHRHRRLLAEVLREHPRDVPGLRPEGLVELAVENTSATARERSANSAWDSRAGISSSAFTNSTLAPVCSRFRTRAPISSASATTAAGSSPASTTARTSSTTVGSSIANPSTSTRLARTVIPLQRRRRIRAAGTRRRPSRPLRPAWHRRRSTRGAGDRHGARQLGVADRGRAGDGSGGTNDTMTRWARRPVRQ